MSKEDTRGTHSINCPKCNAVNDVKAVEHHGVCHNCRSEIGVDLSDPEVVCLCGSTRFKDEYREENQRLTMAGKVVISVGLFGHSDGIEFTDGQKEMLDTIHKRKIDLSDRIHVINVDEYVGDSTQSEIEYARERDIPVTYYEEVEELRFCEDCGEKTLHSNTQRDSDDGRVRCQWCGTTNETE